MEIRVGHLAKNWEEAFILGTRAEADRDIVLHCYLGVVQLFECGRGKFWDQFSLAKDLLKVVQVDSRKAVPAKIDSYRTAT